MSLPDGRFPSDLKVTELKVELEKRGVSKTGNKKDLIERLNKSLEEEKQRQEVAKSESEDEESRNSQEESVGEDESNVISDNAKQLNDAEGKCDNLETQAQAEIVPDQVPNVNQSKSDTIQTGGEPEQAEQCEAQEDEKEDIQDGKKEEHEEVEEEREEERQEEEVVEEEEEEAEAEILQGNVSDDEAITGDIETSEATGTSALELGGGDEGQSAEISEVTTSTKNEEGDNDELEEGEMRDDEDEAESSKQLVPGASALPTQRERSASSTSGVTSTRKRQWGIRRPSAKTYVELPLSSQSLNTLVDVTSTSVNDVPDTSSNEAPPKIWQEDIREENDGTNDGKELMEAVEMEKKDTGRHVVVEDNEDEAMEEGEVPATPLSGDPSAVLTAKLRRDEAGSTESMDYEGGGHRESDSGPSQSVTTTTVLPPLSSPIAQEPSSGSQSKASPASKAKKRGLRETRAVGYHVEDPVRGREAEAATQPESDTIQIRGLVRPFTLNQLKDLLSRYGTLQAFWIDRVKSKSFVQFQSEEEATTAREDLDGCKWPSINPRLLRVDFSSKEELNWMVQNGESGRPFPRPAPTVAAAPSRPAATGGGDAGRVVPAESTSSVVATEKEPLPRDRDRDRNRDRAGDRPRHRDRDTELGSPTDRKRLRGRSPSPAGRARDRDKDRDKERTRDAGSSRRQAGSGSTAQPPMREWDRDKVRQSESPPQRRSKRRSRSRSPAAAAATGTTGGRDKSKGSSSGATPQQAVAGVAGTGKDRSTRDKESTSGAPVSAKEEPARLLDDLFRKTKVLPSIYWLPLSEEQVKQKQREREERAKARQQRPNASPNAPAVKGASGGTGASGGADRSRQAVQLGRRRSRSRSRSRRRDWDPRRR